MTERTFHYLKKDVSKMKNETATPSEYQHTYRPARNYSNPYRLFVLTALSTFIAEFFIMYFLSVLPALPLFTEAFLDGLFLTGLLFPLLYWMMLRPMLHHMEERKRAEDELQKMNEDLEDRVRARTEEIRQKNRQLEHEVEERKRAQKTAQESEAFLLRIIETMPEMMFVYDLNKSRCIFVNGSVEDVLGYKPEDIYLMGKDFPRKILNTRNFSSLTGIGNKYCQAQENGVLACTVPMTHADGAVQEYMIRMIVLSQEEEVPRLVLCTVTDHS